MARLKRIAAITLVAVTLAVSQSATSAGAYYSFADMFRDIQKQTADWKNAQLIAGAVVVAGALVGAAIFFGLRKPPDKPSGKDDSGPTA